MTSASPKRMSLVCACFAAWALAAAPRCLAEVETPAFITPQHVYERGAVCELSFSAQGAESVAFDVDGWLAGTVPVRDGSATYTIDTNLLRVDDYTVRARPVAEGEPLAPVLFALTIAPPHDDERIPVWRWGGGVSNPDWWMQRGFTGGFTCIRDPLSLGSSSEQTHEEYLDRAARRDFELGFYFHPLLSNKLKENAAVQCIAADGETAEDKPYPLHPDVLAFEREVVDSYMARFHDHPGLRHVMFHSEYQTPFSINDCIIAMAQEDIGLDPRHLLKGERKPPRPSDEELADGIIEDDDPNYRFLQWWWQRGHGTAPLNEQLNGVVKGYNPNVITWHEPYRLAPVRYSHKGLDCIGTWTYGHPDIKRLCYTTYLQAAARPEGQLVHQDITLFVYGRFAVPLGDSSADLAQDFAGKDPHFTAGPDFAREGMWLVMSQRPDILCFYSAGRLSPEKRGQDPFYASPDTFSAIGQTCDELVKPYGPALLKSKRCSPRTAVLMSAASTWFAAAPRLPGYPNEQTLPYATLLMMNHVPFDVLLDEDIAEGALERYDILVMPRADTLTRSMYDRIVAFAQGGGKVIADKSLRAEIPGARITDYDFMYQRRIDGNELSRGNAVTAEESRTTMEGYAKDLASLLSDVPKPADSESLRVLTNGLEGGAARYYFFVNDDRTYGPRFGEHKLFFELGVPQTASVSIDLEGRPALYDALLLKPIEYETRDGRAVFDIRMAAARGKLIAALPEPIGKVAIEAPETGRPGERVTFTASVLGESGAPLPCVLPLQIKVVDPLGRDTEWCRYTATKDGVRTYSFTPALNDARGEWTIRVVDLIAGTIGEHVLVVE